MRACVRAGVCLYPPLDAETAGLTDHGQNWHGFMCVYIIWEWFHRKKVTNFQSAQFREQGIWITMDRPLNCKREAQLKYVAYLRFISIYIDNI